MKHKTPYEYSYSVIAILCLAFAGTLFLAGMPITAYAGPGNLDPTFSGDGKLTDLFPGTTSGGFTSTAVQPDGKIIAIGYGGRAIYIARYNVDGSQDTAFGSGTGKVAVQLPDEYYSFWTGALAPDGKVVVAGCYCHQDGYFLNGAFARFNSDGSLDTSFGSGGFVNYASPLVAISPDGGMVTAGYDLYGNTWIITGSGFQVITPDVGYPTSIATQTDGKVVAAGVSYTGDFAVVRYLPNGALDTSFDGDGIAITPITPGSDVVLSIAIQPDGKIVAVGPSNREGADHGFAVVRYLPNGSLDTTFDNDGMVVTPSGLVRDGASSVAIQFDKKIVVAGTSSNGSNNDFALIRYNPNGSVDTTFGGGDGKATVDFNNSDDQAYGMALDGQGRAVLVGSADDGKFAIARFLLSPDQLRRNGKIAFTSDRDGNREIYLMNADGTNQTRLTNNSLVDELPTWSPDGTKIAFVSQKPAGDYAIFQMDANGTNKVEITPLQAEPYFSSISWSPDGSRIAFNDGTVIFTINSDGSERQTLSSSSFGPAWSPDGSKILFATGSGALATLNPDSTDFQFLLGSGFHVTSPRWSPDGNKMVYVYDNESNEQNISTADADGTNRQHFDGSFCPCQFERYEPSFSPDSNKIVFTLYSGPDNEIVVKNIDGTGLIQLTSTSGRNFNPSWQPLASTGAAFDFDGDGRTDVSVFRPSEGKWYLVRSTDGINVVNWGVAGDKITPADFDGDGKTDVAVYRPSNGGWYVINSATTTLAMQQWGSFGDTPATGDFDGDGQADRAVFRAWDNDSYWIGRWYVLKSSGGIWESQFGQENGILVPQDYDGDGLSDPAFYDAGIWQISRNDGSIRTAHWGQPGDIAVPADYDGDGTADLAVWRPSDGKWYIRKSGSDLAIDIREWGVDGDVPVPGDYDGDGSSDLAIYRNGAWYLLQTSARISVRFWGISTDRPVPAAFLP